MSSPLEKSPGLGSLAQSARGKQLKQARNILLVIGVLTILVNAFLLANVRNEATQAVGEEVKKVTNQGMRPDPAEVQRLEDHVVRVGAVIYGAVIFLGILFVVFGLTIKGVSGTDYHNQPDSVRWGRGGLCRPQSGEPAAGSDRQGDHHRRPSEGDSIGHRFRTRTAAGGHTDRRARL